MYHMVKCHGEAHRNPRIDHCGICAPLWGEIPVCDACGNPMQITTRLFVCRNCRKRCRRTDAQQKSGMKKRISLRKGQLVTVWSWDMPRRVYGHIIGWEPGKVNIFVQGEFGLAAFHKDNVRVVKRRKDVRATR
jgi:hypothetical protein